MNFWDFFESLEHGFFEIGTFVFISLTIYAFVKDQIRHYFQGKSKIWVASLLGVLPGCGGAISVTIFYLERVFTPGMIVAAMVATMGDGAFILMGINPLAILKIMLIGVPLSFLLGYIVDHFKWFKPHFDENEEKKNVNLLSEIKNQNKLNSLLSNYGSKVFFVLMVVASFIQILSIFKIESYEILRQSIFVLVFTLTIWNFIYAGIKKICLHHFNKKCHKERFEDIFRKCSHIFFFMWIGILIFLLLTFFDIKKLFNMTNNVILILMSGLIGFFPGSGTQMIVTSLFLKGIIPFPVLLANTLVSSGEVGYLFFKENKKNLLGINFLIFSFAITISLLMNFFNL